LEIENHGEAKSHDRTELHSNDFHKCMMKLVELVIDKRIAWLVTDNYFNFTEEAEWTGTKIVFDITKKGNKTEIRFRLGEKCLGGHGIRTEACSAKGGEAGRMCGSSVGMRLELTAKASIAKPLSERSKH
jgi:hypothetical protein